MKLYMWFNLAVVQFQVLLQQWDASVPLKRAETPFRPGTLLDVPEGVLVITKD